MDENLRQQRREIEQRLYRAREERAESDNPTGRMYQAERVAREAMEAFDAAHPEIIEAIRAGRAEKIHRDFEDSAVARGTD